MLLDHTEEPIAVPSLVKGVGPDLSSALGDVGTDLVRQLWSLKRDLKGPEIELLCHGRDPHGLLLAWLELLIYAMDARQAALTELRVQVKEGKQLTARARVAASLEKALAWPTKVHAESAALVRDAKGSWKAQCQISLAAHPH